MQVLNKKMMAYRVHIHACMYGKLNKFAGLCSVSTRASFECIHVSHYECFVCSNLVLRLEQDSRYCEYSGIVSIARIARCVGASSIAICCPALNYIHMRAREGEHARQLRD